MSAIQQALIGSDASLNTPPVTTGLQILLDAERDSAFTGATALDWSGNSYNATQGTAGFQPSRVAAVLNGRAVYRFDGTDDYMEWTGAALGIANNQSSLTVYFVAKSIFNGVPPGYIIYFSTGLSLPATRFSITLAEGGTSPGFLNQRGRRLDSDSVQVVGPGATLTDSTWRQYSAVFDWANSNADVWVDEVSYLSTTSFQTDGNTSATDSLSGTFGGYLSPSPINTMRGDIAFLAVYRGAHSTSDRQLMEAWLAARYGL